MFLKVLLSLVLSSLLSFSAYASNDSIPMVVETQCMTCHTSATIIDAPFIAGQKKSFIEWELFNFKNKVRVHEIMNTAMQNFSDDEVREMAEYISNLSLCKSQADMDDHSNADVDNGRRIFMTSCKACHLKTPAGVGPVLHGQKTSYMEFAIRSFRSNQDSPRPSKVGMNIFVDTLSDQEIADVAAYLNTQKLCDDYR